MKNKETYIKLGIVTFFFLIIIIITVIVMTSQEEKPTSPEEISLPFDMEEVKEYSHYFSVLNNINQYIYYTGLKDSNAINNILFQDYLIHENIKTPNDIINKISIFSENDSIKVKNMYFKQFDENILFYVKGDIITDYYDSSIISYPDVRFFVFVDYNNLTFAIYPYNDNSEEQLPFNVLNINIIPNNVNKMQVSGLVTDDYICNLYLSDFYNQLQSNIENSYELLEENYKQKVFNDKNHYISYIGKKLNNNLNMNIRTCNSYMNTQNQREYNIITTNNSTYTFIEESIMNYKVRFNMN